MMIRSEDKVERCGYVAIIGRPNVGKSTLLNQFLGEKISIISRKPQTTRHKILGIHTEGTMQTVFVDTPGLHKRPEHIINRCMIKTALTTIRDVDAIVLVLNASRWNEDDDAILKRLRRNTLPLIVAVNKIDKIKDKTKLLPILKNIDEQLTAFGVQHTAIIPISARFADGMDALRQQISTFIPDGPHLFPADQRTDRNERFIAAELVREKIMRLYGDEVPHCVTVQVERFVVEKKLLRIDALIWVERTGQKKIIIGDKGAGLKEVGRTARLDMEKSFGKKVFLQLWIKVKKGWTDDLHTIRALGY